MSREGSVRSIARCKAAVDNGFSRVGRTLSKDDRVAAWLQAAAGRAVALCDAVILLCREHHAAESAALVRGVIQLAADMRWVAAGPGGVRVDELERAALDLDWGALWSSAFLRSRLAAAGLPVEEAEARLRSAARLCAAHLSGGAAGLPWAHAFPETGPRLSEEEALDMAAKALRDALAALEAHWTGSFVLEEAC